MEELVYRYLKEFETKKDDKDWCIEFIKTFTEKAEEIAEVSQRVPELIEKIESVASYVLQNASLETKLEFGLVVNTSQLQEDESFTLNSENLNKYKDTILKVLNQDPRLPDSLNKNSDLLVFCLENGVKLLIFQFDMSLFTREILDKYENIITEVAKDNSSWLSLKYSRSGTYVHSFYDPEKIHLYDNYDFFEFCLKNGIDAITGSFFFSRNDWFTAEVLEKYHQSALKYFTNMSTYLCSKNLTNDAIFEFCCKYGAINVILTYVNFQPKKFTDDFIVNHKEGLNKFFQKYGFSKMFDESRLRGLIEKNAIDFGIDNELALYKYEYLRNINDEVFSTLIPGIFKNDFDLSFLSRITVSPSLQRKIIEIKENSLNIFKRVAKFLDNDSLDLSSIITKFLDNIEKYEHLLDNVDVNGLSDEEVSNFLTMLISDCDFSITSVNDLKREQFNVKRKQYFDDYGRKIENYDLDEIKKSIFQKQYGIDLKTAMFILERYDCDRDILVKNGVDEKIINIICGIREVIECDSKPQLIAMYQSLDDTIDDDIKFSLESEIRKHYAKLYNDTLYHIDEHSKKCDIPDLGNILYNGKKIEFYEVEEDFAMQIHALGAYSLYEKPANFKDDWNRPKIASHGICTSYITNSQIATAIPSHPIIAFSNYEESSLLLAGNYDLGSDGANLEFDISSEDPCKILPPKEMINRTRHNHNEMVIERCKKSNMRKMITKRQPSYLVYIIDTRENADNFDRNYNKMFGEVLQAAADMNIPVVVVDRSKYATREMAKCNELEEEFKNSHNLDILNELMLTYFNNNVGSRFFTENPYYESFNLFTSTRLVEFYNRLLAYVLQIKDKQEEITILSKMIEILKQENSSYSVSHKSDEQPKPFDFDEAIQKLNEQIKIIKCSSDFNSDEDDVTIGSR